MKKIRRILAMVGVIIILFLYVTTIVLAIFGNDKTQDLLRISIYATVVVPVLIWAYTFIGRLLGKYYSDDQTTERYLSEKNEQMTADHSSDENEQMTADHSSDENEQMTANHSSDENEQMTANHSSDENEQMTAEHSSDENDQAAAGQGQSSEKNSEKKQEENV